LACRAAAEECCEFLTEAQLGGVLTAHEAESMLHPLYDSIGKLMKEMRDFHSGKVEESLAKEEKEKKDDTDRYDDATTCETPNSRAVEAYGGRSEADKDDPLSENFLDPLSVTFGKEQAKDASAQEPSPDDSIDAIIDPAAVPNKPGFKGAKASKSGKFKKRAGDSQAEETNPAKDVKDEGDGSLTVPLAGDSTAISKSSPRSWKKPKSPRPEDSPELPAPAEAEKAPVKKKWKARNADQVKGQTQELE